MQFLRTFLLWLRFRHPESYYILMPDGLYDPQGIHVKGSGDISSELIKGCGSGLRLGDRIALQPEMKFSRFCKRRYDQLFVKQNGLETGAGEKSTFVSMVEMGDMVSIIKRFPQGRDRTLYERFLEEMILISFIESIKNSKVMMGGVWINKEIKESGKSVSGYEVFVKNLSSRNQLVDELKPMLAAYPKYDLEEIGLYRPGNVRDYMSSYSRYLENVLLLVLLKNSIQELVMMMGHISDSDRIILMRKIDNIKMFLKDFEYKAKKKN